MQTGAKKTTSEVAYCFNCGASNAADEAVVTVGYRSGGGNSFIKEGRPHCKDCADVENGVSSLFLVILMVVAAVFLAGYIINELF